MSTMVPTTRDGGITLDEYLERKRMCLAEFGIQIEIMRVTPDEVGLYRNVPWIQTEERGHMSLDYLSWHCEHEAREPVGTYPSSPMFCPPEGCSVADGCARDRSK